MIGYLELQLNQVMETSQIMKLSKTTIDVLTQINGSDVATFDDIGEIPKIFYRVPVSATSNQFSRKMERQESKVICLFDVDGTLTPSRKVCHNNANSLYLLKRVLFVIMLNMCTYFIIAQLH